MMVLPDFNMKLRKWWSIIILSTSIMHSDTRMSSRIAAQRIRTSSGQCRSGSARPANEPLNPFVTGIEPLGLILSWSEALLHSHFHLQLALPTNSQLILITYPHNQSSELVTTTRASDLSSSPPPYILLDFTTSAHHSHGHLSLLPILLCADQRPAAPWWHHNSPDMVSHGHPEPQHEVN